jgi:hypothetical protein
MSTQTDRNPWVIRCDYSDDRLWEIVKIQIATPRTDPLSGMEFTANIRCEEDLSFRNLSYLEIVRRLPDDYPGFVLFLVDANCIQEQEHPLLVVGFSPKGQSSDDFSRTPKETPSEDIKTFRAIPSTIPAIENNLSIANMDFDDFFNAVDAHGVFRGF